MIVRISGEGQYEIEDGQATELNRLDNEAVAAVEATDEAGFTQAFEAMLRFVRENGRPLAPDDLHESAVILPPADLTLAEAAHEFSGEGILPD